jgi:glycosyltransferase involved in cell wall biosynthesis
VRIAFDAQLTVGTATGIGEYARGLIPALVATGVDVIALRNSRLDPWRFDRRVVWDQLLLPARASLAKADLLHCASGTIPLLRTLPVIATVHDVAFLKTQRHARGYARWYFGKFSVALYRRCKAIIADSEFSRKELLDVMSDAAPPIVAIHPGVADDFSKVTRTPDRRTVLVVGTVERRKNLAHTIRLLPRLKDARIVSVGPATPYFDECVALANRLGVAERIEFRGYVPRRELLRLYATAAVAVVPSTYEGFGYAAAQALCAGLPCVTSDRASLLEVAGSDATVVSLDDEDGWLSALASAVSGADDERAGAMRDRSLSRFSWKTAAERTLDVYRKVTAQ